MLLIIIYIVIILFYLIFIIDIYFNKIENFNGYHTLIRSDIGNDGQSLIKKVDNYILNLS